MHPPPEAELWRMLRLFKELCSATGWHILQNIAFGLVHVFVALPLETTLRFLDYPASTDRSAFLAQIDRSTALIAIMLKHLGNEKREVRDAFSQVSAAPLRQRSLPSLRVGLGCAGVGVGRVAFANARARVGTVRGGRSHLGVIGRLGDGIRLGWPPCGRPHGGRI